MSLLDAKIPITPAGINTKEVYLNNLAPNVALLVNRANIRPIRFRAKGIVQKRPAVLRMGSLSSAKETTMPQCTRKAMYMPIGIFLIVMVS